MLPLEEDTLAIMKWRLAQWPPNDRWYPILLRYIDYLSKRVDGLGGNSNAIRPSPWGAHPPSEKGERGEKHHKRHQNTGKVSGLIFDRFGDLRDSNWQLFYSRRHHPWPNRPIAAQVIQLAASGGRGCGRLWGWNHNDVVVERERYRTARLGPGSDRDSDYGSWDRKGRSSASYRLLARPP
jgi:hypothetical protein